MNRLCFIVGVLFLTACNGAMRDLNATDEARIAATPRAKPQKTITNFSRALQCMDGLFVRYNIKDLLIGAQDIKEPNAELQVATKDMFISALSRMSQKSKAVRYVMLSYDFQDVSTMHNLHKQKNFRAPDFFVRISMPQLDKGVSSQRYGLGIRFEGAANLEFSKDRLLSIISLDMNLGVVKTLQMIPGISSSNSIAVARKGLATDLAGTIRKFGALIQVNFDRSEGLNHSLRTLVDLGAIELVGSLAQVPYWECLDIESTSPDVQSKIQNWYRALSQTELRVFVQSKLEALGLYSGPVDGKNNAKLRQAVALYKERIGLIADGRIDFDVYYHLIADRTPIKTAYLPMITKKIKSAQSISEGEEDEYIVKDIPQNIGLKKDGMKPLMLNLQTNRGANPVYHAGELFSVRVSVSVDSYVYCYYQQWDNKVLKLFPNRFVTSARVKADEMLLIPGGHFKLRADKRNSEERIMCMASYTDIDQDLPAELSEKNLKVLPVARLEDVYNYYKMASSVVPLWKILTLKVR